MLPAIRNTPLDYDTSLPMNRDFQSIMSYSQLSPGINEKVQDILLHRQTGKHYFIHSALGTGVANFTHETFGTKTLFPSLNYRLLALAKFWNMAAYFYPYRHLSDFKPWTTALDSLIPLFIKARDSIDYYYCLRRMTVTINDNHAGLSQIDKFQPFGTFYTTFTTRLLQDKLIVTQIRLPVNNLKVGDEIIRIDGVPVKQLVAQQRKYISAHNEDVFNYWVGYSLVNGDDSISRLTLGDGRTIETKRYKHDQFMALLKARWAKQKKSLKPISPYYLIDNENVGYVDLGRIKAKNVKNAMKLFRHTKGIIIDLRDSRYPQMSIWNEFSQYLSHERLPFYNYYCPNYNLYGTFILKRTGDVGHKQKLKYKGRIAVLVNAGTQSREEFCVMAFQTFPNVKVVGTQIAGTDGDISNEINLSGGYTTRITGAGITYPDGRQTQRIGIVPDIPVSLTASDIKENKDPYLTTAIKYIRAQ